MNHWRRTPSGRATCTVLILNPLPAGDQRKRLCKRVTNRSERVGRRLTSSAIQLPSPVSSTAAMFHPLLAAAVALTVTTVPALPVGWLVYWPQYVAWLPPSIH